MIWLSVYKLRAEEMVQKAVHAQMEKNKHEGDLHKMKQLVVDKCEVIDGYSLVE